MRPIALMLFLLLPMAPLRGAEPDDLETRQAELQEGYDAYEVGLDAAQRGDYDTALGAFREAAEDGLDVAQYNLGVLYYTGRGVSQDYGRALEWLERAAEQGHTASQFNAGVLYFNSQGTRPVWQSFWPLSLWTRSRDRREAARWYEQAAESGHAEAQYYLATMYQNGTGVERNLVRAHFWAQAARENNYAEAEVLIGTLENAMSAGQVSEARRLYADQAIR